MASSLSVRRFIYLVRTSAGFRFLFMYSLSCCNTNSSMFPNFNTLSNRWLRNITIHFQGIKISVNYCQFRSSNPSLRPSTKLLPPRFFTLEITVGDNKTMLFFSKLNFDHWNWINIILVGKYFSSEILKGYQWSIWLTSFSI